jgi:hypothetical protein
VIPPAKRLWDSERGLGATTHLGNITFDKDARTALDHYQRGVLIGEISLGEKFDGVLSWGMIDNRPFLRCLNGLGLCLWRLERFEEAEALFTRMLWMSPGDILGVCSYCCLCGRDGRGPRRRISAARVAAPLIASCGGASFGR